jgi:hypothetical protein
VSQRHLAFPAYVVFALVTMTAPVSADQPVGVVAGGAFPQGNEISTGIWQLNLGASYDVWPSHGPFRLSIDGDYANGSAQNLGISDYGFGFGARLTTPIYAGLSAGFYTSTIRQTCSFATPGVAGSAGGGGPSSCPTQSGSGFGSTYFVGVRVFSGPGFSLSLQGGYRQVPLVDGVNPSGTNVEVRLQI